MQRGQEACFAERVRGGILLSVITGDIREGPSCSAGTRSVISDENWNRFPLSLSPGLRQRRRQTCEYDFFFFCLSKQHIFLLIAPNLGLIRAREARWEIIYRRLSEVFSDIIPPKEA